MTGSEAPVSDASPRHPRPSRSTPTGASSHRGSGKRLLAEAAGNPLARLGLPIALSGAELGAAEIGRVSRRLRPLRTELIEILPHAGVQGFCEAGG